MGDFETLQCKKESLEKELSGIEEEIVKNRKNILDKFIAEYNQLQLQRSALLEKIKQTDVNKWAELMGPSYVRVLNCPTGKCTINEIHGCCDNYD